MMKNIKYAIEGILFAAGEPVKAAKLAAVLEVDIDDVTKAVDDLKAEYEKEHRGFAIIDILEGYQICSRPEYYTYIQEILGEQRKQPLSNAAMEALAIIAYKQPITRGQVEHIRGVNSDGCVNRLFERGLIEEAGRLDAPGRPILYRTTDNFLRCFGLTNPQDLPPLDLSRLNLEEAQGMQLEISDGEETVEITEETQQSDTAEGTTEVEITEEMPQEEAEENTGI